MVGIGVEESCSGEGYPFIEDKQHFCLVPGKTSANSCSVSGLLSVLLKLKM